MNLVQLHLMQSRRFLPLFLTQFLGAFNDNIFKNALVILIAYRFAEKMQVNAQILVTLAAFLFILPFFLFSATAGQLADKFEKSKLIIKIKLAEVILMLLAFVGFYLQNTDLLLFILFALGTQATFFGPLKYAILPIHLKTDELIAGNGLIEGGTFIAILLGTLFGGLLVLLGDGEIIISITIISVALLGWFTSFFIPHAGNYNSQLKINYNIVSETKSILLYAKQQTNIFAYIFGISWFWLVGAIFLAEIPVFAKDILYTNQNVVTLFFGLFSVGLATGSLLCNKLLKGQVHARFVPVSMLIMSVFMFDLCYTAWQPNISAAHSLIDLPTFVTSIQGLRICADLLLLAICGGIYTVPLYALLQLKSKESHRARIIASNNVMNALFMVIAALATLALLKMGWNIMQVFLITAISNTIAAFYLSYAFANDLLHGLWRSIKKYRK